MSNSKIGEHNPKDAEFLTDRINEEYAKHGVALPFSICIRDKKNQIIAGCSGSIIYGSIYTDQLWVHQDYRRQGLGFELLNKVHNYGISQKCAIATVCTMSFQDSLEFYKRAGYKVDHTRKGYTKHAKCLFLQRLL